MSFKIDFLGKKIIATFSKDLKEGELTTAFIEIVDTINIKEVNHIIFDCSKALDYNYPSDYMTRTKVITQFSTAWNADVKVIFVATNLQVRQMALGLVNHYDDLEWTYHLFENISDAHRLCNESE
jgi:hypothetical protein